MVLSACDSRTGMTELGRGMLAGGIVTIAMRTVRVRADVGETAVEVVFIASGIRAGKGGTMLAAVLGVVLVAAGLVAGQIGAEPIDVAIRVEAIKGFGAIEAVLGAVEVGIVVANIGLVAVRLVARR